MKQRILPVVGARPNFMKIAPIMRELAKYPEVGSESHALQTGLIVPRIEPAAVDDSCSGSYRVVK